MAHLFKPGDRVAYSRFARDCRQNATPGCQLFETGTIDRDSVQGGQFFWWIKPDGPASTPEGDGVSRLARDLREEWELMVLQDTSHGIQSR